MSKPKVYVTRRIPAVGVEMLKAQYTVTQWESDEAISQKTLIEGVKDAEALLCMLTDAINKEVLDKAPKLKVISTMSVGYNHIDLEECKKRSIKVGYTPNVSTESVAEMAMALMLAAGRRVVEANKQVLNGGWTTWKPLWMLGKGMEGSTIGIVGLGRIGFAIAVKCKAFKPAKIVYQDVKRIPPAEAEGFEHMAQLSDLLKVSDYVVCCCALTFESRRLFDKHSFDQMKKHSIFVNISRGDQVDHEALLEAMKSGHIAAAGLDVTTPEPFPPSHALAALPNCIITPHIGSSTVDVRDKMASLAANNVICGLEKKEMPAPVPQP